MQPFHVSTTIYYIMEPFHVKWILKPYPSSNRHSIPKDRINGQRLCLLQIILPPRNQARAAYEMGCSLIDCFSRDAFHSVNLSWSFRRFVRPLGYLSTGFGLTSLAYGERAAEATKAA